MLNHSADSVSGSVSNDITHNESGFCYDPTHECHENEVSLDDLQDAINDGLVTTDDANNIKCGRTV